MSGCGLLFWFCIGITLAGVECAANEGATQQENNRTSDTSGRPQFVFEKRIIPQFDLVGKFKHSQNAPSAFPDDFPLRSVLVGNRIYMLARGGMYYFDLDTRTISNEREITKVIHTYAGEYHGVQDVIVGNDRMVLVFLRGVVLITMTGGQILPIPAKDNIDYVSASDSSMSIFTSDTVLRYNLINGSVRPMEMDGTLGGHCLSYNGQLYVVQPGEVIIFDPDGKIEKVLLPQDRFSFQDPYLACITSKYLVWYPYGSRDQLALMDRSTFDVSDFISLVSLQYQPNSSQIEYEEGQPLFHVLIDHTGRFYIVLQRGPAIEVYVSS